jgi:hypothetical protein
MTFQFTAVELGALVSVLPAAEAGEASGDGGVLDDTGPSLRAGAHRDAPPFGNTRAHNWAAFARISSIRCIARSPFLRLASSVAMVRASPGSSSLNQTSNALA